MPREMVIQDLPAVSVSTAWSAAVNESLGCGYLIIGSLDGHLSP
jgi:hypothetical protein